MVLHAGRTWHFSLSWLISGNEDNKPTNVHAFFSTVIVCYGSNVLSDVQLDMVRLGFCFRSANDWIAELHQTRWWALEHYTKAMSLMSVYISISQKRILIKWWGPKLIECNLKLGADDET